MKEKSKELIRLEKNYFRFLEKQEAVKLGYQKLPTSYPIEKLKEIIKIRKKEITKYNNQIKKDKERFQKIGIDGSYFHDSYATKSTFLYYLTEKNFKSLNIQYMLYEIDKHEIKLYKIIDVIEKVAKNNTQIRYKNKDEILNDKKLSFIRECFLTIEKNRREAELVSKLTDKSSQLASKPKSKKI